MSQINQQIPTETVKRVDHVLEDIKNSAVISASLVMIGPFPPIPAIVETNEELYLCSLVAKEEETKQEGEP